MLGRLSKDYVADIPIYQVVVGFAHSFQAGAEGHFSYAFTPLSDGTEAGLYSPEFGPCQATLNTQNCDCYSHFCDASETSYNNVWDCSMVPGGGVVDLCDPPSLTTESPLFEILALHPLLVCYDAGGEDVAPSPTPDNNGISDSGNPSFIGSLLAAIFFCFT